LATDGEERAVPSLGKEEGEQHQLVDRDMRQSEERGTVLDKGLATYGKRRAVQSLGQDRQQYQRADRNPGTVPNPKKVRKVEKKGDYHLNCQNLWWQWMEMEGGMKERGEKRL
jgi:hypothetical protein